MANVARFRSGKTAEYLTSVHTADFSSDPDCLINPNVSAVLSVPLKYWKRVSNTVVEMTAGEKSTVDTAAASALITGSRAAATNTGTDAGADGIRLRAVVGVLLDEINTLRQWLASFKTEVASASNLADLKTRVATLPGTADRTLAQGKTAYINKISSGVAD